MRKRTRQHAVVMGGSIAGMCAARALSDHFERVTLIERDVLPTEPQHRAGVPQSHHVHALLLRGLVELERLFPGIEQELAARGAQRMDLGDQLAHFSEWGWAQRARIDVAPLTMSRLLVESVVRSRVRGSLQNLTVLEKTRVRGLISESDGNGVRVVGVETDRADKPVIRADLIVDASGRNSKTPEWLETIGLARPEEDLVDAHAGYASRFYELAPDQARWWRGMLIDPKPPAFRRWALMLPVENNRWVLTLAGVNRDYPPTDEAGFHAYLESLRSKVLAREIARATPLSDIHGHRSLWNRARRYDRWGARVAGFIAMGDSAIAFNASHGQGMSMAALSATTLGDTLARAGSDPYALTKSFHKAQWKALRMAWDIAIGMDLQWPDTVGHRPLSYRLLRGFGIEATRAAHEDPSLKMHFGPVFQLVASPYSALTPGVVARVLYRALRRRVSRPQLAAPTTLPQLPADAGTAQLASDTGAYTALG